MDLNPRKFEAPFDAFELARHHVKQQTDILFCIMAWQESDPGASSGSEITRNHQYWATRLSPLIGMEGHTCHVVICNRVGIERGM